MIGYYEDCAGKYHGFLQNAGQFYSFDFVGAVGTTISSGINGIAQAVGSYGTTGSLGFTLSLIPSLTPPLWAASSFSTISYLGSNTTDATGMNNNGQVVGVYLDSNNQGFSFLYDSNTNTYSTITNAGWLNF